MKTDKLALLHGRHQDEWQHQQHQRAQINAERNTTDASAYHYVVNRRGKIEHVADAEGDAERHPQIAQQAQAALISVGFDDGRRHGRGRVLLIRLLSVLLRRLTVWRRLPVGLRRLAVGRRLLWLLRLLLAVLRRLTIWRLWPSRRRPTSRRVLL